MLKGIPKILSPELLMVLSEMGHSDRLVISDGNFPAESMGKDAIVIRCDGHGVPELLDAILQVFPLDTYVEQEISSALRSMMRRRPLMRSSLQASLRFMRISCFRKAWLRTDSRNVTAE